MQYVVEHPEEMSKVKGLQRQVKEVQTIMENNIQIVRPHTRHNKPVLTPSFGAGLSLQQPRKATGSWPCWCRGCHHCSGTSAGGVHFPVLGRGMLVMLMGFCGVSKCPA